MITLRIQAVAPVNEKCITKAREWGAQVSLEESEQTSLAGIYRIQPGGCGRAGRGRNRKLRFDRGNGKCFRVRKHHSRDVNNDDLEELRWQRDLNIDLTGEKDKAYS